MATCTRKEISSGQLVATGSHNRQEERECGDYYKARDCHAFEGGREALRFSQLRRTLNELVSAYERLGRGDISGIAAKASRLAGRHAWHTVES